MRATLGKRKTNHVGNVFQWVQLSQGGARGESLYEEVEVKVREGRDGASISNAEAKLVAQAQAYGGTIWIVCDEMKVPCPRPFDAILMLDGIRRLGACKLDHHLEMTP